MKITINDNRVMEHDVPSRADIAWHYHHNDRPEFVIRDLNECLVILTYEDRDENEESVTFECDHKFASEMIEDFDKYLKVAAEHESEVMDIPQDAVIKTMTVENEIDYITGEYIT